MASDDRRTCPIFRIEPGTFQESHTRALNCDFPSINDDEDVFLRVTKLSSANSSPLSVTTKVSNHGKNLLVNSAANNSSNNESWDDVGRSLQENNSDQLHSVLDDYVFL
ncbi:unnamed protein product [Rotaria magnacalcarata]|nr:unnamed protein product [Rotaria magnacalcarata]